jgi:hypothetical protein
MPGLVGGYGKIILSIFKNNNKVEESTNKSLSLSLNEYNEESLECFISNKKQYSLFCSYLAGLIEGDGTFAIHSKESTAKKYSPHIIIVFKYSDLPVAQILRNISNCGIIYNKPNRGYILWEIQSIIEVYTIVNFINGFMRTPKIEALERSINWLNEYRIKNKNSKLPSTKEIISKMKPITFKDLDNSPIDSNAWLSGFTDADGNFTINIHKRTNKNSIRVQLFYRMEIRQTYHRLDSDKNKLSFYPIIQKLALFLKVNVISRSRIIKDKQFYSFIVTAYNKESISIIINYLLKFPLLSSKYLDFKVWESIFKLQQINPKTLSYLDKAINVRKDFNKSRTTYKWDHLKDCYFIKNIEKEK